MHNINQPNIDKHRHLIVIGGGLSGCEAAWQAAERGVNVTIYEMRESKNLTFAHKTDILSELVCSNSFRNDDVKSAIGLLHEELRLLGSLIMKSADETKLPAGGALAVDREAFAYMIQEKILSHPNITVIRGEIDILPDSASTIVASGPLTSGKLTQNIIDVTGQEQLAFFDAIAPILYQDSIDFNICWKQSRYDKSGPGGNGQDYINCPMSKEQYYNFIDELIAAEKTEFKEWEKNTPYFNGCLPIEVMAERGRETLRFGPMKPVGLTNPQDPLNKPYAVVQLRQDNKLGTLYNIVGFQTKLKYGEQQKIFRMIPGLENAEFARLGGLHRNTFIKSPDLLDKKLRLKNKQNIRFAGQITGVEGYVESASMGVLAGIFAANDMQNIHTKELPNTTAIGSLLNHITLNANSESFQPMNINYGLFPALENMIKKIDRPAAYSNRALIDIKDWIKTTSLYL